MILRSLLSSLTSLLLLQPTTGLPQFGTGSGACQSSCTNIEARISSCTNPSSISLSDISGLSSTCLCNGVTANNWATYLSACIKCMNPLNQTLADSLGQYESLCGTPDNQALLCTSQCAIPWRGLFACSISDTVNPSCICAWDANWSSHIGSCAKCLRNVNAPGYLAQVEPVEGLCGGSSSSSSDGRGLKSLSMDGNLLALAVFSQFAIWCLR
jgi:hypothetical protein